MKARGFGWSVVSAVGFFWAVVNGGGCSSSAQPSCAELCKCLSNTCNQINDEAKCKQSLDSFKALGQCGGGGGGGDAGVDDATVTDAPADSSLAKCKELCDCCGAFPNLKCNPNPCTSTDQTACDQALTAAKGAGLCTGACKANGDSCSPSLGGQDCCAPGATCTNGVCTKTMSCNGDGGACPNPLDVGNFIPPVPSGNRSPWQSCSMGDIQGYYDACVGPNRTSQACMAFQSSKMSCAQCLESLNADAVWGAFVVDLPKNMGSPNTPGCLSLKGHAACAKAWSDRMHCEVAGCESQCPISTAQSIQLYDQCVTNVDQGCCKAFDVKVQADCNGITDCLGTLQDRVLKAGQAFCGM